MSTVQFVQRLQSLGVALAVDGDRLRCSAPKDALSTELRAELARRKPDIVALLSGTALGSEDSNIPRAPREQPLPLSFSQERMWLLHQLEPESSA